MTDKATYIASVASTAKVSLIEPTDPSPALINHVGVLFLIHPISNIN